MTGILLTQSTTPIIGQVAWLLGKKNDRYSFDTIDDANYRTGGVAAR